MTQRFQHKSTASAGSFRIYGKTGAQAGKVYDFNDGTWDTIGAATTPYVAATKLTDFYGTGQHQFFANVDLSDLNATGAEFLYEIAFFSSATPATTDNPASDLLEFSVINGSLDNGPRPIVVRLGLSTNTLGDEMQVSVWLERDGAKVDLSTLDAGATCRVIGREHGAASGTLTVDTDDPAVSFTMRDDILEGVVDDPNLIDAKLYMWDVTLTAAGVDYTATDVIPVWGS